MLAMSIHGTGEGPSKGCSFYPFALLEKKKKHKKSTHTHTKKKSIKFVVLLTFCSIKPWD